jgi:hypothetical protein
LDISFFLPVFSDQTAGLEGAGPRGAEEAASTEIVDDETQDRCTDSVDISFEKERCVYQKIHDHSVISPDRLSGTLPVAKQDGLNVHVQYVWFHCHNASKCPSPCCFSKCFIAFLSHISRGYPFTFQGLILK